ncbi:hypothetical protein [Streptomyces sp. NPDC048200]|uniref:hypothetical protein n=1 Tax=Streptomyces sp. NPDC048200 TaxID=3365512 RepID=UPI0037225FFC
MSDRDEALQQAMERVGGSMRTAILKALLPPPLPARDDPAYRATALLHHAHSLLTIAEHPDLVDLGKPSTEG